LEQKAKNALLHAGRSIFQDYYHGTNHPVTPLGPDSKFFNGITQTFVPKSSPHPPARDDRGEFLALETRDPLPETIHFDVLARRLEQLANIVTSGLSQSRQRRRTPEKSLNRKTS